MQIPEQNKYREAKESELVVRVDRNNHQDIKQFIETVIQNPELKKIDQVVDSYNFISQMLPHLEERDADRPFKPQLDYLVQCVENHGLPEPNHLDDHADKLIAKYSNGYGVLLDGDPILEESFEIVKAHRSGEKCSERYEAHLHHLHESAQSYDESKEEITIGNYEKAVNF